MHYVYIVRCSDDSLYTGYTIDIARRIDEHNNKKGAKCVMGKLPVKLAYEESYATIKEALKREKEIKSWPRNKKIDLINTCS
ncbi:GIY-YIG nuclease family protein [Patescibacteria group bacterium]|nr:GIY-YIG nuclease family protein [Patescibacteria group bacterium]